jgi:hypothetical protein
MKKIFLFLIALAAIENLSAQGATINPLPDQAFMENQRRGLMGREYQNPVEWYRGEQFFNVWATGDLIFKNGITVTGIRLQYEKYLDELLWLREDFKIGIINKSLISAFRLYDSSHDAMDSFIIKSVRLPFEKDATDHYLQVLAAGKISLYVSRRVAKSSNELTLDNITKYMVSDGKTIDVIALNKRNLLHIPSVDREKMKAILKINKINVRGRELDFARALEIYNKNN